MVNLAYVKRRKRKKIVAIVSAASSVVLIAFIIISFLGNKLGSFTISLRNSEVKLELATHSDFRDRTSYLRVEDLVPLDTYCYQSFKDSTDPEHKKLDLSQIDNENTTYLDFVTRHPETGEILASPFFKYTFFVGNHGTATATFTMELQILSNSFDERTRKYVNDILRVMLIEDGDFYDTVYGRRSNDSTHYDPTVPIEQRVYTDYEYICGTPKSVSKFEGFCIPFLSGTVAFSLERMNFAPGNVHRYTLLYWLEGDDPECEGEKPVESKIKLGVDINAYAN